MIRRRRRDPEGGFSLVEVAISSLVLVVAISGLVVTTIYSRNLSESSKHLWHATNAASATLEQIRHQSVTKWSDVTSWNGLHCDYGVGDAIDPYASKLATDVSDDATMLDRSTGMWTAGATVPNFYFVQIHAANDTDEFANTLDFQTYVADRKGLKDLYPQNQTADPVGGGGGAGGPTGDVGTSASYISTTPSNVVVTNSGAVHSLTYTLANGSSQNKVVTGALVTGTNNAKIGSFTLDGVSLFDNSKKAATAVTITGVDQLLPSIAPGAVTMNFTSPTGSFTGQTVSVKLTFADGSTTTSSVKP
jgi:Tfp pilus assembly protein PilV